MALVSAGAAKAQNQPQTSDQIDRYSVEPPTVTLVTVTGHYPFLVVVVGGPSDARSALAGRRRITSDEGILYVQDVVQRLGISNQGVPYPTDLLFASEDGQIVEVHPQIMANDSRVITSNVPVTAALQVLAGTIANTSAAPGDYLLNALFGRTL